MATTPQQGIMALPETDEATVPQLALDESYDAAKQGLNEANPQYLSMYNNAMAGLMPTLMALSDKDLDLILQLIQYLYAHPEEYSKVVKQLETEGGLEAGSLPEEYDENFLATFGAAVLEAQKTNADIGGGSSAPMQPPMQLAKGGIADAARMVASQGRNGDTMLAHINRKEAALLKKRGGSGTINPKTGLPEYFSLGDLNPVKIVKSIGEEAKSAFKTIKNGVKQVMSSTIGRVLVTVALAAFIGPAAFGLTGAAGVAAQMALANAGATALSGGNLKDIVKSGVVGAVSGYGGAALGPAIGTSLGVTSAAGQAALGAGLTNAGLNLVQGKSIKDAVVQGMTSAAIAGGMSYANSEGVSRGTQGQDPNTVPVEDRVLTSQNAGQADNTLTPQNAGQADNTLTPQDAGQVNVNQQTGQVTGGAPTQPAPLASSDQAFNNALANNQTPINGLTMDSGQTMNNGLTGVQPPVAQAPAAQQGPWTDANGAQIYPDSARLDQLMNDVTGPGPVGSRPATEPSMWDTLSKQYDELNISPSSREAAGLKEARAAAWKDYKADIANGVPEWMAKQNYADAVKAYTPGPLSVYGPSVATGLGLTYLAGGFNSSDQPTPSQETQDVYSGKASRDIIAADPTKYLTQNLPGVTYDAAGNITGSSTWTPRSGAGTTTVPGNYIAYSAPTTTLPSYTPAVQRTPVVNYGNMPRYDFTPRYAAQGGMMETAGAFPANPLTMSNPAMAMHAQQMPMNTPGVPMNMPMGYAMGGMPAGGIASLAVGGYPRRTGQIDGPGTETSDSIPAMLSDGEFVMTAKAVKGLGGGSRRAGAKKMYALMHRLENNAARG